MSQSATFHKIKITQRLLTLRCIATASLQLRRGVDRRVREAQKHDSVRRYRARRLKIKRVPPEILSVEQVAHRDARVARKPCFEQVEVNAPRRQRYVVIAVHNRHRNGTSAELFSPERRPRCLGVHAPAKRHSALNIIIINKALTL